MATPLGKPSGALGKHWKLSEETKRRMSEAQKKRKFSKEEIDRVRKLGLSNRGKYVGDKSPRWIGDKVGYAGLHDWVETQLGKPKHCAKCNTSRDTKYEWANRSRKYKRDVTDWIRLCVSCHQKADYHKLPL